MRIAQSKSFLGQLHPCALQLQCSCHRDTAVQMQLHRSCTAVAAQCNRLQTFANACKNLQAFATELQLQCNCGATAFRLQCICGDGSEAPGHCVQMARPDRCTADEMQLHCSCTAVAAQLQSLADFCKRLQRFAKVCHWAATAVQLRCNCISTAVHLLRRQ